MLPTIEWKNDRVIMIDQRKLPWEEVYLECTDYNQVAEAIETMVIRGAPAIGVAAAFGIALGVSHIKNNKNLKEDFQQIYLRLEKTRPTARNLFWALEQMKDAFESHRHQELASLQQSLIDKALDIEKEDIAMCRQIGFHGKGLFKGGENVLTHCNAGTLATAGYGTALGVVRAAFEEFGNVKVFVDETRPLLQGGRLTCWELHRDGIPVVLITDNMAGHLMSQGQISLVVTGADRIAGNGDTANKIGTYPVAVLAQENKIPFFVAAPMNTIDISLTGGEQIPIEERGPDEVRKIGNCSVTLENIPVRNPAFDVTPAKFITAIITEKGIAFPPFTESLDRLRTSHEE